jgi:hypothetical protein
MVARGAQGSGGRRTRQARLFLERRSLDCLLALLAQVEGFDVLLVGLERARLKGVHRGGERQHLPSGRGAGRAALTRRAAAPSSRWQMADGRPTDRQRASSSSSLRCCLTCCFASSSSRPLTRCFSRSSSSSVLTRCSCSELCSAAARSSRVLDCTTSPRAGASSPCVVHARGGGGGGRRPTHLQLLEAARLLLKHAPHHAQVRLELGVLDARLV